MININEKDFGSYTELISDLTELLTQDLKSVKNPIAYIGGEVQPPLAGQAEPTLRKVDFIPCPSAYACSIKELVASDNGRTEDTRMNKVRLGQYTEIALSYKALKTEEISYLLKVFAPSYLNIAYFDPTKAQYLEKEFVISEKSTPLYNGVLGMWDGLSLTITQRKADIPEPVESEPIPPAEENQGGV